MLLFGFDTRRASHGELESHIGVRQIDIYELCKLPVIICQQFINAARF